MRMSAWVLAFSVASLPVRLLAQEGCNYGRPVSMVWGHDDQGYFVRTEWRDDISRPRRGWEICAVGDLAAQQANATVLYNTRYTERDLPRGEWRGADPLAAFRAFAAAAGLEVATPLPDFWVVGTPGWNERTATTIFARPLDPDKQGFQPASQIGEVEQALISQLPVRDGCERLRHCTIGVAYYWLPNEGPDTMLVQADIPPGSIKVAPQTKVFKVRVNRTGPTVKLDCLWASSATGPLLPDVAEDLDGDGVRDFVFAGGIYDYGTNEVVSGRDGDRLLQFIGNELLVERTTHGPKRLGVATLVGEDTDLKGTNLPPTGVLAYDEDTRTFGEVPNGPEAEAQAARGNSPRDENRIDRTRRGFATAVGGAKNVKAYVLFQGPQRTAFPVDEVVVRHVEPRQVITPELVKSGFPARIWFEYKSPSYLAEEERRNAMPPHE